MGKSLEQILATTADGGRIGVTMVSNQDNGIASYAEGTLVFHPATFGVIVGTSRRARLESTPDQPLKMFFSDRMRDVDPPPIQTDPNHPVFPNAPRQPFNVDQTEKLGMLITLGGSSVMRLAVFNSTSLVVLSTMGDVMVGLGPSLGNSAAGVFVVSFESEPIPPA